MTDLPVSGEWTGFEIPSQTVTVSAPMVVIEKLNVVLPFIESDVPQVIRLLKWCAELSGRLNYTLFLLPFKGLNFTEVRLYAEKSFADVQVIQDNEGVTSDWKGDDKIRDAAGPNSMFRQAAWYFYFHQPLGPWLYLEPDCVPLKKEWLEQLETDYRQAQKPILGVRMDVGDRPYLNGVAIYPAALIGIAPELVTSVTLEQHPNIEVAFDVAGGTNVLQKAHLTDKIELCYRQNRLAIHLGFKEGAVLYHGDRDGKLIELLQQGEKDLSGVNAGNGRNPVLANSDVCAASEAEVPPAACKHSRQSDQEPSSSAQTPSIGDEIRYHCDELLRIVSENNSRKKRVVDELRKRKLAPQARKPLNHNQ